MRACTVAVVAAVLGASGCSVFHSNAPATQVYILRAMARPQSDLVAHPVASLRVGRPIADPGLDTNHIMLVQADHRLNYFMGSQWPSNLPPLVEALTVNTLRSSGQWANVQDSSSAFSGDYILQMEIKRFEADYTGGAAVPEIHVVLDCTVGKRAGREVVASFTADGSATAGANRLSEVVAAFEAATNKALAAISEQTAQAVRDQKVENPVPSMTR